MKEEQKTKNYRNYNSISKTIIIEGICILSKDSNIDNNSEVAIHVAKLNKNSSDLDEFESDIKNNIVV